MALIWPDKVEALIVVDTSVVINLNATGYAVEILGTLPVRLAVVSTVLDELDEGRARGRQDADQLEALIANELIEIVNLGVVAGVHFEELTIGPASATLDDGEAATIAYALEHELPVVIDEGKATRICAERFPRLSIGSSVDLFSHPALEHGIGRAVLAQAIYGALSQGRMRVFPQHVDWVIDIIGPGLAAQCHSLPKSARGKKNT